MKKIFIIILLASAICSCGTRKVQKSSTEEKKEMQTETETVEKKETQTVSDTFNDVVMEEYTIEPIDSLQPIKIVSPSGEETIFYNAKIKKLSKTDKSRIVSSTKSQEKKQEQKKENIKEYKKEQHKEIVKKSNAFEWIVSFLILIILGYYIYKRFS